MISPVTVTVDIGGTNTRVALCDDGDVLTDTIVRYRNAEHPGLEPILDAYLAQYPLVGAICIDMAGPVTDGVGTLTNLDWTIDSRALSARTGGARVVVLNDLQAQGHSVPHLSRDSLLTLLPGQPAASDVRLVINVGTGLNAVPVHTSGNLTLVPAAEAGHITLQARNAEELRLVDWLGARMPSCGVEEVLSGRGLEHLDAFVAEDSGREGAAREAAAIMQAFTEGEPRAQHAVRLFARYLGRYAGDLALTNLPFGGIYLVGGVMKHLGPHLMDMGFGEAFADKGRFGPFMAQFPLHLVTDDYAALRGCAAHLRELQTSAA